MIDNSTKACQIPSDDQKAGIKMLKSQLEMLTEEVALLKMEQNCEIHRCYGQQNIYENNWDLGASIAHFVNEPKRPFANFPFDPNAYCDLHHTVGHWAVHCRDFQLAYRSVVEQNQLHNWLITFSLVIR